MVLWSQWGIGRRAFRHISAEVALVAPLTPMFDDCVDALVTVQTAAVACLRGKGFAVPSGASTESFGSMTKGAHMDKQEMRHDHHEFRVEETLKQAQYAEQIGDWASARVLYARASRLEAARNDVPTWL